jgi:MinD-like ATPase involved in chromosome partitioning or flagellar assembly
MEADNGRHRSEFDDQPTMVYAPAPDWGTTEAAAPTYDELPGPPPAAVAPRRTGVDGPPPRPTPGDFDQHTELITPVSVQHDAQHGAPQRPQQQWGQPAGQQWGAPRQVPPGAAPRRAPEAAPRRVEQLPAEQSSPQIPVQRGPQRPAPRPTEPDQYRRPGAPMQAAYAGIQQELLEAAADERSQVANTGWRGAANAMGLKLAPGKKERQRREVFRRIRAPKDQMYSIAVLTLKGGAGKTTMTAALGQVFSKVRADGVIAVDADPDAGDLAMRTEVHPHNLSMVDLLEPDNDLTQRDFVQRFLSVTDADLQVLASGWRPDSDRVLIPEDIVDIHEIASHYFSMLLWDGDKALNSPLVRTVLEKSNALVLLVEASAPGAVKAGQAIDWLRFHGFEGLLARTVVLVNETTANTRLDLKALMAVLARQQLKMHHIPYDKHLDEGMSIDLAKLNTKTREAFEDLAAMLADDFVIPQPPAPYAAAS